jgi:DNA modification methylase
LKTFKSRFEDSASKHHFCTSFARNGRLDFVWNGVTLYTSVLRFRFSLEPWKTMMNVHTLSLEMLPLATLRPYSGNARTHSKQQVRQIADSIRRFGFTNPVLISDDGEIVAGHGRAMAARDLGMANVPVVRLSHLSAAERRAYVLADNKLALNAGWDGELLAIALQALIDLEFDVSLTGFSLAEIDFTLDQAREANANGHGDGNGNGVDDAADLVPDPVSGAAAITRMGDLWHLGRHRLLCGDAQVSSDVTRLVGDTRVDLIFTDPPYNVPIDGNVGGLGSVRHREFAFASGEMSRAQFTAFLTQTLGNAASVAKDGAIAYVCMDWRHMRELQDAGEAVFSELKNLCVWNKTNGGMGSFYRSKHELVFVFKVGTAPHTNSFGLGETGRYRTNVWDYAGISSLGASRMDELAMHPTVKPVALVADAIRDCSRRGETVLDLFGGSGSTMMAAELCGRQSRLMEYDPIYCDTSIRRWQRYTGKSAILAGTGTDFDTVAERRGAATTLPAGAGAGETAVVAAAPTSASVPMPRETVAAATVSKAAAETIPTVASDVGPASASTAAATRVAPIAVAPSASPSPTHPNKNTATKSRRNASAKASTKGRQFHGQ